MENDDKRLKRLIFRSSHRGCKETDLLLGEFAVRHLPALPAPMLALYEDFLEEPDWDIWQWACGEEGYEERYRPIVQKLRERSQ